MQGRMDRRRAVAGGAMFGAGLLTTGLAAARAILVSVAFVKEPARVAKGS